MDGALGTARGSYSNSQSRQKCAESTELDFYNFLKSSEIFQNYFLMVRSLRSRQLWWSGIRGLGGFEPHGQNVTSANPREAIILIILTIMKFT